jgi:hypothetical protein
VATQILWLTFASIEAILALSAAAILIWELRSPAPNEGPAEERAAVEGRAVRALWAKPQMRNMAGLVFVGFGVFVALATAIFWLAGNLGGLVVGQALVPHPTPAFLAMAALSLPDIWPAERFRPPPVPTTNP